MPVATARTVSLRGATGHLIDVQADVSPGSVVTTLIGRVDAGISEARDRCRMAIINSGLEWPSTKRITILLSPADLPKRGTHVDLAIAVAVLAAENVVPPVALDGVLFVGELTLDGGLRSVPGVLPMVMAAVERGLRHVVVPEPQAREAAMVPGVSVLGMRSLAQVVAELRGDEVPTAAPVAPMSGSRLLTWRGDQRLEETDLVDLVGMADAKYAAEVAASGGHALLLTGSKGSGKTSLAERIPGLLPDLSPSESLELTAIHSLAGALEPADGLLTRPPYAAPHHDASKASLIGGGSGQVRPGDLSRCHGGVLFLDEFALFRRDVIEALRQPLESGDITVARQEESVTLPARCLLVLACNPCPCGDYSDRPGHNRCRCRPQAIREYQAKIQGPIADRIDITRDVGPLARHEIGPGETAEPTAVVRERVTAARERQRYRYADRSWRFNGELPGAQLRQAFALPPDALKLVEAEVYAGRLSSRGAVRVQRLAWTLADLAAARAGLAPDEPLPPTLDQVAIALSLRQGQPLASAVLARRAG